MELMNPSMTEPDAKARMRERIRALILSCWAYCAVMDEPLEVRMRELDRVREEAKCLYYAATGSFPTFDEAEELFRRI